MTPKQRRRWARVATRLNREYERSRKARDRLAPDDPNWITASRQVVRLHLLTDAAHYLAGGDVEAWRNALDQWLPYRATHAATE